MKDGFNINEIEVIDKDKPKLETLLTGDVIKGLDPHSPVKPNSEIEKNEWIKFPDGTVQLVVGQKHETGGVKMNIPDGTKIISDNLTLTKDQVKFLKDAYGIKANTTDTYAKVVKTYSKEIGLDKLNQEQEEAFAALKKEMDSDNKEGTSKVNRQYLSGVINKLEKSKEPKRKDLADFFERVFTMQESTKKPESKEGEFKYGGISQRNFENLCKKHNLTTAQGLFMLENGGQLPMYKDAGEKDGEPDKSSGVFKVTQRENIYKGQPVVYQHARQQGAYGNIEDPLNAIQNLYNNFPDIVSTEFKNDIEVSEDGTVSLKNKNLSWNKKLDKILTIQQKMDKRMRASANDIIKDDKGLFDDSQKELAKEYLTKETFTGEKGEKMSTEEKVRAYDSMLGNFTSGRYSLGLDLVTPEEQKLLNKSGVKTVNQLVANQDVYGKLSEESKARVDKLKGSKSADSDYFIDTYKPITEPAKEPAKDEKRPVGEEGEIIDKVKGLPKPNYPKYYYTPEQTPLPPSALEAEYMANIDLQRMDPMRIGTEAQKQAASDQLAFAARQTEGLPESQRAAVLASMLGTTQGGINEAILQTNIINQKNQADTELFNIGQAGQESLYAANNKMAYSDRAMQGKALQEEAVRNYYDRLNNISMNTFQNQQRLNLMDSLFPDVDLDFMGATVSANGQNPLSLEDRKWMTEWAGLGLNPNIQG